MKLNLSSLSRGRLIALLILTGAAVGAGVLWFVLSNRTMPYQEDLSCVTKTDDQQAVGETLQGIVSSGETIQIRWGYYGCNPVQRGDIVVERGANRKNSAVKIVRAIPGDEVSFVQKDALWNILVNKKIITTSSGVPYVFSAAGYELFKLSFADTIIPPDSYLIMSNLPETGRDITFSGLVMHDDLLGRVSVKK